MPYSAPMDGIRAIAVLAVLIFHIAPGIFGGGFTGVDSFFVLSGFLITSNILNDLRRGRFAFREFYLRRMQRLLPNVIATVLAVLFLWGLLMPSSASPGTGRHGLWAIFNLSNIYIWRNLGGYWSDAAEWAPLTHTWSLGVEEQFYIIFPVLLLLLAKTSPRHLGRWLAAGTSASFALFMVGNHLHPTSTFYLLPTRVWELLIGAFLAELVAPLSPSPHWSKPSYASGRREAVGIAGMTLLLLGFFLIRSGSWGGVYLVPTTGTVLVIWAIQQGSTRLSSVLACPALVAIGKRSYSIYLWHWPLIILGKSLAFLYGKSSIYGILGGAFAGLLLAVAAYEVVEQPLRQRGLGRGRRFGFIGAGFLFAVIGSVVLAKRPPQTDPSHRFNAVQTSSQLFTVGRRPDFEEFARTTAYCDVTFPAQPVRTDDAWRTGGIIHPYGGGMPKLVVMGSSHALMYSKVIDEVCCELGISVAYLCMDSGTPAFFCSTPNYNFNSAQEAAAFDQSRRHWLHEWRPSMVLIIDRWDCHFPSAEKFTADLHSFLQEVSPLTDRILFVTQVPVLEGADLFNLRELVTWRIRLTGHPPRLLADQNESLRLKTLAIAQNATAFFPKLRILRADAQLYNDDGSIRYFSGPNFFYTNTDHLSDSGAEVNHDVFRRGIEDGMVKSRDQQPSPRPTVLLKQN